MDLIMHNVIEKFLRKAKIFYESDSLIGRNVKIFFNSHFWYYISFIFIRFLVKRNLSFGRTIMIETTNCCNARCIMCPMGIMKRKKGAMSDSIFELVLRRIKDSSLKINMVWVSGFGEPLLDQHIFERIKTLKSNGFWVKFSTNGSLLDDKKRKSLLDSGIDEINISFNGANKIDYEKTMSPLKYDQTSKNILSLFELRKKMGLKKPILRISSVLLGNNTSIQDHLKKWEWLANSVSVAMVHKWGGTLRMSSSQKMKKGKFIWPCRSLWDTLYIAWNGDVYPCCVDYEGRLKLGNLKKQSLDEISSGQNLDKIKKRHLTGKYENLLPICKGCDVPFRHGLDWFYLLL